MANVSILGQAHRIAYQNRVRVDGPGRHRHLHWISCPRKMPKPCIPTNVRHCPCRSWDENACVSDREGPPGRDLPIERSRVRHICRKRRMAGVCGAFDAWRSAAIARTTTSGTSERSDAGELPWDDLATPADAPSANEKRHQRAQTAKVGRQAKSRGRQAWRSP